MGGPDQGERTNGRERTNVVVRLLSPDDVVPLRTFFSSVPEGDRTFFKEDVTAPGVIEAWAAHPEHHRLIAVVDDGIVGYAAVLKGVAWSSHVGEVRLLVAPEFRNRSIGRLLAQRVVVEAEELGVDKLTIEVVAGHHRLLAMFAGLGFEQEGRLRGQVRWSDGETRDVLVLSHFVDALAEIVRSADV